MEITTLILSILLMLFALLAIIDGFYLHIIKYKLYSHAESKKEHLFHTIRAILFPAMLYFLFLKQDATFYFYIGIFIVLIDILILGCDAYIESDSRAFMGGLPRWEYILHLFVNGFHFASVFVFLGLKLYLTPNGIKIYTNLNMIQNYAFFNWLIINLLPGAVLMALLHLIVLFPKTAFIWDKFRAKITY